MSLCLELPNPCPGLHPAEGGKRKAQEVSQYFCFIRAQRGPITHPGLQQSVDPFQWNSLELGHSGQAVGLGLAPSWLPLSRPCPCSIPALFPGLSTTGSSINPAARSAGRYPPVNDARLKLGSISCLLLFPIMQTRLCPLQSCLLSQLLEALPNEVSFGIVKNITTNSAFCFFVLCSVFTPGLMENDVKHQE